MKSIFNISQEFMQLSDLLLESGGEVTPELETALTINKQELEVKAEGYGFIVKQIQSDCEIIDSEIERLKQQKKYRENAIERLKITLAGAMTLHGYNEIKTPLLKINFRKSETCEIDGEVPEEFIVKKTTESIDKAGIKAALKAGREIPGAYIMEHQNLQIK